MASQIQFYRISLDVPDEIFVRIIEKYFEYQHLYDIIQFFSANKSLAKRMYSVLYRAFGKRSFYNYANRKLMILNLERLPILCSKSTIESFCFDDIGYMISGYDLIYAKCIFIKRGPDSLRIYIQYGDMTQVIQACTYMEPKYNLSIHGAIFRTCCCGNCESILYGELTCDACVESTCPEDIS
jgi:hypothetical protein